RVVGISAARICAGISAGCALLPVPVSPLGMAAVVLFRGRSGFAGAICALPGEGVGGLGKVKAGELASSRRQYRQALETLHLPGVVDDRDEPGLAWYPGHVSDISATLLEIRAGRAVGDFRDLDGG